MDEIGGWSHYDDNDFKEACAKLKIAFPTPEEDETLGKEVLADLKKELSGKDYDVEFSEASLSSDIMAEPQRILGS